MNEPASVRNRRLTLRRPAQGQIRVVCQRGGQELGANLALSLLNLSEDGACLVVKEALDPGQEVSLSLETLISVRPVKCPGVVAWILPHGEVFSVGIRFERRLAYTDLIPLSCAFG